MLEFLISILLGILAGIITGIIPGIHINLVAVLILSSLTTLLNITSPLTIVLFIVAMSITHTFLDAIPSIFLGAPESSSNILTVLPGHKFLIKGRGYEAVKLTVIGSLLGLIIIILLTPTFIIILPKLYSTIKPLIPYILILASIFLILRERNSKFWALLVFLLAGILGIITLNLKIISQPLFPLLSGLFGISTILLSIKNKVKIPKQKLTQTNIKSKEVVKALSSGTFAATLVGTLPGVGGAEAAIIATSFFKEITQKTYLILIGSINTIVMIVSFLTLYTIQKTRSGSAIAISRILELNLNYLIIIIATVLITAGIATILALLISKFISQKITQIKYSYLNYFIISLIVILTIIISKPLSLLVLITATSIGMLPQLKKVGKHYLMGSLIIPVIIFYLTRIY